MALVLTLKQGEDFYVDKDQYFLEGNRVGGKCPRVPCT